jgi:hypothetical protein
LALKAIAHASALVAFVLCGSTERGAVIAAAWGALVGVRALWPRLPSRTRRVYAAVAAGLELVAWWLLAAARGVHVVEAYTLPLAAVALFCGWLAARSRPLGSWIAYGPALLAASLPSLAPALALDASVARRVVVGAVALAVVLIGGMRDHVRASPSRPGPPPYDDRANDVGRPLCDLADRGA